MSERYDSIQFLTLHRRLCEGDRTASEEIICLLLPSLIQEVSRQFPQTDEQIISDGVTDALLEYCAQPNRFDEKRGVPLDRFLQMAAWRNVANSTRRETRRKAREAKVENVLIQTVVELDPVEGNILQMEEAKLLQQRQAELISILPNQKDREILVLRLQGERRTEVFAKILEISHLPLYDQRREVKRVKDRIDKALQRHAGDKS